MSASHNKLLPVSTAITLFAAKSIADCLYLVTNFAIHFKYYLTKNLLLPHSYCNKRYISIASRFPVIYVLNIPIGFGTHEYIHILLFSNA